MSKILKIGIELLFMSQTTLLEKSLSSAKLNEVMRMTVDLDVLLSVAEISVAFAGFAGIITAVTGRTSGGGWDPANLTGSGL